MLDDDEAESQLLAVARLLESWADALPTWDELGPERWDAFLDRLYEGELALAARLRNLPSCQMFSCPQRRHVDLSLAGIHVSTRKGLTGACQAWAHAARGRGRS